MSFILVQVLHRDELEFPWSGRGLWRFEDPRGARTPREGHAPGLRAAYLERLHAHLDRLDRGCADNGLHLHRCVSDQPLTPCLLAPDRPPRRPPAARGGATMTLSRRTYDMSQETASSHLSHELGSEARR